MRKLEPPAGYNWAWAMAVNDRGEVVGYAAHFDNPMSGVPMGGPSCRWTPEGLPVILEQTEELFSIPLDVNHAGQIVGFSRNELGYYRATLWMSEAGDIIQIDLGTLDEELQESFAVAINELGQVVGYCTAGEGLGMIIKDPPSASWRGRTRRECWNWATSGSSARG